MNCLTVRDHLFSYHENQLSEEEKYAFDGHLKSCKECAAIFSGIESLDELIQQKKSKQPNPFIHTRTIQRIESEGEKPVAWYLPVSKKILRPVVISFILFFAVGAGSLTGWYIHNKSAYNIQQNSDVESIRSGLAIDEFIDEGYLFITNQTE